MWPPQSEWFRAGRGGELFLCNGTGVPAVFRNDVCYAGRAMPDTRLILHVKGTESEYAELSRQEVRDGLAKGEIPMSQLIWSPAENTWKEAQEFPGLLPEQPLILHVKGTESETKQLPKEVVRTGISKGDITHSQLIWNPAESTWKQVREMPHLLPSQKLAPAIPVSSRQAKAIAPKATAVAVAVARTPSLAEATVATPKTGNIPKMRARAAEPVLVRSTGELEVKHASEFHPVKWVCIALGIFILVVIGGNYFFVNQPMAERLSKTRYARVPVYVHLGAFLQPNVLVIHIRSNRIITPENLGDFLVTLAANTGRNPMNSHLFERVALTSGWTAQYSFSGADWKQLGTMAQAGDDAQQGFLMSQMDNASGQVLLPESTLNPALQAAKRDEVWSNFLAHFAPNP
jgi:hypothetical protein